MHDEPGYWMSEGTQYHLLRVRDQLRLLATLAAPRTCDEGTLGAPTIPLQQWAHFLQHLAEQVDDVLEDLTTTS
ncbi:XAC0095 family protein [Xanthomonas campestris]|uniref:XAC0095 family protein n=1 Tax=Xanthomonas campestris TaxID=339 RepID=UPI0035571E13